MRNRRREAVAEARLKVVFTAQEEGVSAAARKHGHARSTVQRLLRRWEQAGGDLRALCNRPRGNQEPIAPEVQELIEQLKLERLEAERAPGRLLLRQHQRTPRPCAWPRFRRPAPR